jgi:homopolymeric O-antigen transport system ATP-binding protein
LSATGCSRDSGPCSLTMSRPVAIDARGLAKMYRLYARPLDQVLHLLGLRLPWRTDRAHEFWALRDVNLIVGRGERVGIVGRNGAGKSTLLKMIAGVLTPTEGSLTVQGRVQALMELGTGFHPDFSGRENVLAALAYLGVTGREAEERLAEIVEFAELEDFIDQPVKTYSAGMYTRLAFSVATSIRPEILIIDEILSAGDAYFGGKCSERMRQLTEESRATVLFVSHDLAAVQKVCTRAIWLDRGRIVADGETLAVCKAYSAAVRDQEELRLRARNLGVPRRALAGEVLGNGPRHMIGHLIAEGGGAPRRRHAIHRIALTDGARCWFEIRVGDAMDNDPTESGYVITRPGYIDWSEPVRLDGRYVRFFEDRRGRYRHAAFALRIDLGEHLSPETTLEIDALIGAGERLLVELFDGERYVSVGNLGVDEARGWEEFTFPVPRAVLEKFSWRSGEGGSERDEGAAVAAPGPVFEPVHETASSESVRAARDTYGSGEIQLAGVDLLDGSGQERAVFTPGDALAVRLRYRARTRVEDPVFVLAIYGFDGTVVSQVISSRDGVRFGALEGEGHVEIRFDPLLIGRGRYVMSAGIFPAVDWLDVYAYAPYSLHDRRYELRVDQAVDCAIEMGLLNHPVEWRLGPHPAPSSVGRRVTTAR